MLIKFSFNDMKFLADTRTGDLYPFIDVWVRKFYDSVEIPEDAVVVDVGAHIGFFTVKAATKAKKGVVIAIEPHPESFRKLLTNIELNGLSNVVPLNLALWSKQGILRLYESNFSGTHTVVHPKGRAIVVKADTLDNIASLLGIKRIDLLKIDVEGAELEVLKGAEISLEKSIRSIALEADSLPTILNILRLLRKYDFNTKVLFIPQYTFYKFVRGGNIVSLFKYEILDHFARWFEKKNLLRDLAMFLKGVSLTRSNLHKRQEGEYCIIAIKTYHDPSSHV